MQVAIICMLFLTGFGFLTFELEDSVDLVVNEHFIKISGKQVVSVFLSAVTLRVRVCGAVFLTGEP